MGCHEAGKGVAKYEYVGVETIGEETVSGQTGTRA